VSSKPPFLKAEQTKFLYLHVQTRKNSVDLVLKEKSNEVVFLVVAMCSLNVASDGLICFVLFLNRGACFHQLVYL